MVDPARSWVDPARSIVRPARWGSHHACGQGDPPHEDGAPGCDDGAQSKLVGRPGSFGDRPSSFVGRPCSFGTAPPLQGWSTRLRRGRTKQARWRTNEGRGRAMFVQGWGNVVGRRAREPRSSVIVERLRAMAATIPRQPTSGARKRRSMAGRRSSSIQNRGSPTRKRRKLACKASSLVRDVRSRMEKRHGVDGQRSLVRPSSSNDCAQWPQRSRVNPRAGPGSDARWRANEARWSRIVAGRRGNARRSRTEEARWCAMFAGFVHKRRTVAGYRAASGGKRRTWDAIDAKTPR
jgi:hypothetical protein